MGTAKFKFNVILSGVFILSGSFLLFLSAEAGSYDYYVDGSYSGDEEGSKEKPFSKISDAIEAGGSGSKIFIKKGEYDEDIAVGKGVGMYGESRNKVFLSGGIEMKDNSLISGLTVEGGTTAILIDSDASAEIDDCTIKKFGKIGVDATIGNGKVVVKNSSIYGGEGKGIYVQQGRKIEIYGNDVYGNGEEGIDVRAKVDGFIKGNSLYDNGESGIEIIIGSSNVLISGNNIRKNGASGIASQFYVETKKTGEINIKNNKIIGNKKYGLDCGLPSGGKPDASYWSDSINLLENSMEDNGMKAINPFCKIIDAVDEVEIIAANKTDKSKTDKNTEEIFAEEKNSNDEEAEEDERAWENAETINIYQETIESKINEQMDKINSTGKTKLFFFGASSESLEFIEKEIKISRDQQKNLESDLEKVKNEETRLGIQSLIEKIAIRSGDLEKFVQEKEKNKGILGWLLKIFKK